MWAVVPVKRLGQSKTRLAPVLNRTRRARLTLLMAHDVLEQLGRVENLKGVGVLSGDGRVKQLARHLNLRVWADQAGALNSGLQTVATGLAEEGSGVMVVPCDVPSARSEDFQRLLAGHGKGVTLVAASADGGTNALLLDAGPGYTFHFGPGSFDAHVLEAERRGLPLAVEALPRLSRDIDRPGDLRWLLASDHDCRARDYLLKVLPEPESADWMQTG